MNRGRALIAKELIQAYEETGRAVEALKLAYKAIDEAYGDEADPDSD